jgi:hypothetical protein
MAPKKNHRELCLTDKIKLIRCVESGEKKKCEIAAEFKIPRSTLSTILKSKEKILSHRAEGKGGRKFRQKSAEFVDVEKCVLRWFRERRESNIPLSGPFIKEKALQFATSLGHTNFKASNGWLHNFKTRYGIAQKNICGESRAVDDTVCDEWKKKLVSLLSTKKYAPSEIFNADESGLFYRCLPDKTLHFKNDECSGVKQSKERLTVLLAANMTGSEKRPPLVIGKYKKPRCFKNVKSFPTGYEANAKAWMTGALWAQWVLDWDRELSKKKKESVIIHR